MNISTHQLAEQAFKALGGSIALEEVLSAWHGIGKVIKAQLVQKKGVRITAFGTFTLTSGEPTFLMGNDFAKQNSLRQRNSGSADNIPTSALNFEQLGSSVSQPRDIVEKIINKLIYVLGRCVREGRTVSILFHRIAAMHVEDGELKCEFMSEFIDDFRSPSSRRLMQDPLAPGKSRKSITSRTLRNTSSNTVIKPNPDIKGSFRSASTDRPDRDKALSGHRGCNNPSAVAVAGRTGYAADGRPQSAQSTRSNGTTATSGTRASADTMSLLHSPRAQRGDFSRPGGLKKENLDRLQSEVRGEVQTGTSGTNFRRFVRNPEVVAEARDDARAAAARALGTMNIIDKVKSQILKRGGCNGIASLGRLLRIMDDDGDKKLSRSELKFGLRDYGIDLSPTELEQVFLYFDSTRDGFISVDEFLIGMRGEMSDRRKKLIKMAFSWLDKDRSGAVDVDEIMCSYDFAWHPDVKDGKKTVKEAAKEFMLHWGAGAADGVVTYEEFEDHYKGVSSSIDNDDYFELMIRNAWRMAGGEGQAANTANRRVLVTDKNGNQSVQTIKDELGMKVKDMGDIKRRLGSQGVDTNHLEMYGQADNKMDKPTSFRRGHSMAATSTPSHRASSRGPNGHKVQPWGDDLTPSPVSVSIPYGDRDRDRGGERSGDRDRGGDRDRSGDRDRDKDRDRDRGKDRDRDWEKDRDRVREASRGTGGADRSRNERTSDRDIVARLNSSLISSESFDPLGALRKIIFDPPVSMNAIGVKLNVSMAAHNPRVAQGALVSRMSVLDPTLTRSQLLCVWRVLDPQALGSVEVSAIHSMLSSKYGKDKDSSKVSSVVQRVLAKILEMAGGLGGIKGLARALAMMDDDGDKRLSKGELKIGLQNFGIDLNIREVDDLFTILDRDRNGFIDVTEFLVAIKGDMNSKRRALVCRAFELLDTDKSGVVTTDEIAALYDVSLNPEVISGKKSKKQAYTDFMQQWDRSRDGLVTHQEFEDYYKEISATIDADDNFELMIRNAWRMAGGEGQAANTANRRVLVTDKNGNQSVQTIKDELGMKVKDVGDIKRRLGSQGVDTNHVEMYGQADNKMDKPSISTARPVRSQSAPRYGSSSSPATPSSPAPAAPSRRKSGTADSDSMFALAAAERIRNGSRLTPNILFGGPAPVSDAVTSAPKARNAFERHKAAMKLGAVFRGNVGRKIAETERRKVDAISRQNADDLAEAGRPRQARILRPQGKSYIGF